MRIKLPALSETCDRYAISDRSAAAISSAVLQDIGVITNEDKARVIDRSKIRRQRLKKREEAQSNVDNCVNGPFFDGRKDKTMTQVRELDGKLHRRKKVEEHICLIIVLWTYNSRTWNRKEHCRWNNYLPRNKKR